MISHLQAERPDNHIDDAVPKSSTIIDSDAEYDISFDDSVLHVLDKVERAHTTTTQTHAKPSTSRVIEIDSD